MDKKNEQTNPTFFPFVLMQIKEHQLSFYNCQGFLSNLLNIISDINSLNTLPVFAFYLFRCFSTDSTRVAVTSRKRCMLTYFPTLLYYLLQCLVLPCFVLFKVFLVSKIIKFNTVAHTATYCDPTKLKLKDCHLFQWALNQALNQQPNSPFKCI